ERLVDHPRADAEPCGRRAVDDDWHLEASILLIAADVAQLGHFTHGADQARRPGVQRLQVVALQRELILGVAGSSIEAHVLDGLEIECGPRHLRALWPETRDDVVRDDVAAHARINSVDYAA